MIGGVGLLDRLATQRLDGAGAVSPGAAPATAASDFAAAVSAAANRTIHSLAQAESVSMTAMQGGGVEARQVVDAVMSAEQSLQAAISIRDKIVTAYLEISRMAI